MKNNNNKLLGIMLLALLGFISTESYAAGIGGSGIGSAISAGGVGLDSMFANFSESSKALTRLVKYTSYIIGIFLVINSIFKFSQLGSNPQMSPKVPITMFFCGIGVFAMTSTVSVVSATMAMGPGPGELLMPSSAGFGTVTAAGLHGVLLFIRLVGYIAFVRGWLLLNQAGQGKDGVIGRGLTHLGGGVAAINVDITAKIFANTFAPGMADMIP